MKHSFNDQAIAMMTKAYKIFVRQLQVFLNKNQIITDQQLCFTLATDASFYRLTPKVILKINNQQEMIKVLQLCHQLKLAYTFRAAGTSLSGQAISDSILIMLTQNWQKYQIINNGSQIKLQPGIIGSQANRYLAPYQRKIGPDPASINSCKIGGIAANNASGMCCGVAKNSYHTLVSMKLILADGSVLNTADAKSIEQFKQSHTELIKQINHLAEKTQQDLALKKLIEQKYQIKNTMGYSLNALIDYQDPIQIIQHLMIGSEGTLGFISDITYQTVIDYPFKATALVVFENIESTCLCVTALSKMKVAAVELMDARSLQSIADKNAAPQFIQSLNLEAAGLLIECQAESKTELSQQIQAIEKSLKNFTPINEVSFTSDKKITEDLWNLRKGLFPSVAAFREKGTSVIIEDVAFPINQLAAGTRDLQKLLFKYNYHQAVIFGHALDGNLHFVFTQNFSAEEEIKRYQLFIDEMSKLLTMKYKGSLKAEHGTGRNMAPFVELEWGKQAYQLMSEIKSLFDPHHLMNPGVIINPDQKCHVSNLKMIPAAHDIIDDCMECGFCESVCPSQNLSLTPRQRIVMFRQIQYFYQTAQIKEAKNLEKQFNYLGIETCATTGLCAEKCPVNINTGNLIKQLRHKKVKNKTKLATWIAVNFSLTTRTVKRLLAVNQLLQKYLPDNLINAFGKIIHQLSFGKIPLLIAEYPTANNNNLLSLNQTSKNQKGKTIVYFPSCTSRNFGTQKKSLDQRSLTQVTFSLLKKAGYQIIIPEQINNACCGMPFDGKGYFDLAKQKQKQLEKLLISASNNGQYPILMDTSLCAKISIQNLTQKLSIYDPTEFAAQFLIDQLTIKPIDETVALHITCSSQRDGLSQKLIQLIERCTSKVFIPENIHCCGWAGDKGFTLPQLNKSALNGLKQQLPKNCTRGFSTSLTCEIGLSHHAGIPYQSILYLLDEVSEAIH